LENALDANRARRTTVLKIDEFSLQSEAVSRTYVDAFPNARFEVLEGGHLSFMNSRRPLPGSSASSFESGSETNTEA
jgi:hypothetical protein